jgi:hypothetical protein
MDQAFDPEEKQAYQLVGWTSIGYFLIAERRKKTCSTDILE